MEDGYDDVAHVGGCGRVIERLPWKISGIGRIEIDDGHDKNTHLTVVRIVLCGRGYMANGMRNEPWVKANTCIIVAQVFFRWLLYRVEWSGSRGR